MMNVRKKLLKWMICSRKKISFVPLRFGIECGEKEFEEEENRFFWNVLEMDHNLGVNNLWITPLAISDPLKYRSKNCNNRLIIKFNHL
jgi:hypothetical protein